MRIRVQPEALYTYVDASVVCGEPELADDNRALLNPVVIVEVLSKTTEARDRGFKFTQYRGIPTLREMFWSLGMSHASRFSSGLMADIEYFRSTPALPLWPGLRVLSAPSRSQNFTSV